MEEFVKRIKQKITTEYGLDDISLLDVNLAVELFCDIRNYPSSYSDEKKLKDMEANINKIAMAAVELDAKDGVEGQTSHSENGTSRTYGEIYIKAYQGVCGFAHLH